MFVWTRKLYLFCILNCVAEKPNRNSPFLVRGRNRPSVTNRVNVVNLKFHLILLKFHCYLKGTLLHIVYCYFLTFYD